MEGIAYFVFYSFLGWIIDSTYRSVVDHQLTSVSYLGIPFLPIYGFGALFVLIMHPALSTLPLWAAGLSYGLVLAAWELVGGLFCVHVLHKRLWAYEGRWAISSHTSVDRIFAWGFCAIVLVHVIHPRVGQLVHTLLAFRG